MPQYFKIYLLLKIQRHGNIDSILGSAIAFYITSWICARSFKQVYGNSNKDCIPLLYCTLVVYKPRCVTRLVTTSKWVTSPTVELWTTNLETSFFFCNIVSKKCLASKYAPATSPLRNDEELRGLAHVLTAINN